MAIEQERAHVAKLQDTDDAFLKKCNEASTANEVAALVADCLAVLEEEREVAVERGADAIRGYCDRRIWYWSIRLGDVTGSCTYSFPSIVTRARRSPAGAGLFRKIIARVGTYHLDELLHSTFQIEKRSGSLSHWFPIRRQSDVPYDMFCRCCFPMQRSLSEILSGHRGLSLLLADVSASLEELLGAIQNRYGFESTELKVSFAGNGDAKGGVNWLESVTSKHGGWRRERTEETSTLVSLSALCDRSASKAIVFAELTECSRCEEESETMLAPEYRIAHSRQQR